MMMMMNKNVENKLIFFKIFYLISNWLSKLKEKMQKFLDCEKKYLEEFNILKKTYISPIRSSKVLDENLFKLIFSSLEYLYIINNEFYMEAKESTNIGETLRTSITTIMKPYMSYLRNKTNIRTLLKKEIKKNIDLYYLFVVNKIN
jgi:hypothetical protein